MRVTITATAEAELVEKATKLDISKSYALELGLRQAIRQQEDYSPTIESLQDNIANLQDRLREKCERIEQLEHSQGISPP